MSVSSEVDAEAVPTTTIAAAKMLRRRNMRMRTSLPFASFRGCGRGVTPLECRPVFMDGNGNRERVEITISSRFENIELVQVIAEHLCENAGLDEDGSHWIGMAVREAVANAIKHGNKLDVRKKVNATFHLHDHELEIKISDEGAGFDPAAIGDPLNPQNLMKTSGRGIFYMKTFMDQVRYSFAPGGGTSLVMTKNLAKGTGIATSSKH